MKCFQDGCENSVAYSFVWGWGAPGHCCEPHRIHAQQVHDAQERGPISFSTLDPNAKAPSITRDERTMLIAAKLSAEEELVQVQAHAANLHNECEGLRADMRRTAARNVDLEQRDKDREKDMQRVIRERDEALMKLHQATGELERTKRLIPRDPTPGNVVG
jgi:hypothetical protein